MENCKSQIFLHRTQKSKFAPWKVARIPFFWLGKIAKIHKKEGDVVQSAELIGEFLEGADIRSDDLPKDQKKEQIDLPSAVDDAAQVMADAAQNLTKTGPAAKKIAKEKILK